MIPGLGQEMCKINVEFDLHFTKWNRSPLAPVYLALPEDRGQEGQRACRLRAGVKEGDQMRGYSEAMVHCSGFFVKTETLISPVV